MKITRIGWVMCLGASLAACGGGEPGTADDAPGDAAAAPADGSPPAAAPAAVPPPRPSRGRTASAPAPVPTAADSAAARQEDVSPEWKMNQRNMAPYADCMAQANSAPEHARARLAAACGNLPDAPK
ncbi:MAG TPA: hypothetical protein VF006_11000 [Longimicrobium sp.]